MIANAKTPRSPNGSSPEAQHPLRFVFFGASILSDWHNPAATTVRAVMCALTAAGHEALFLEQRQNQPTVDLLNARGSSALRAFAAHYKDLHYRTYDLPTGLERTIWFVRQTATVDAVVLMDGAPPGVFEEAERLDARHLTRVVWSASPDVLRLAWADARLAPAGTDASPGVTRCGPAVEQAAPERGAARSGVLIVAYDDADGAEAARATLVGFDPVCLSAGSVGGVGWPFVPEVDLPQRYRQARVAIVTGVGDDPFGAARALLPLAHGCRALALKQGSGTPSPALNDLSITTQELANRARHLLESGDTPAVVVSDPFDAATSARVLVETIRRKLAARLV